MNLLLKQSPRANSLDSSDHNRLNRTKTNDVTPKFTDFITYQKKSKCELQRLVSVRKEGQELIPIHAFSIHLVSGLSTIPFSCFFTFLGGMILGASSPFTDSWLAKLIVKQKNG